MYDTSETVAHILDFPFFFGGARATPRALDGDFKKQVAESTGAALGRANRREGKCRYRGSVRERSAFIAGVK